MLSPHGGSALSSCCCAAFFASDALACRFGDAAPVVASLVSPTALRCVAPPLADAAAGASADDSALVAVRVTLNGADWAALVSDDAKDLIRKLLEMNPRDRFTAEQALAHAWVKDRAPANRPDRD